MRREWRQKKITKSKGEKGNHRKKQKRKPTLRNSNTGRQVLKKLEKWKQLSTKKGLPKQGTNRFPLPLVDQNYS